MFPNMKILCVDDSGLFRHTLRMQLQVLGIVEVVEKDNTGSAASHLASDPGVDLVIADHHMSSGSGLDFLKWIRSHEDQRVRSIPFIMVTASNDRDLILNAAQEGVSHFLIKPLALEKLKLAIDRFRDAIYA